MGVGLWCVCNLDPENGNDGFSIFSHVKPSVFVSPSTGKNNPRIRSSRKEGEVFFLSTDRDSFQGTGQFLRLQQAYLYSLFPFPLSPPSLLRTERSLV